jgi:hypothetical protein
VFQVIASRGLYRHFLSVIVIVTPVVTGRFRTPGAKSLVGETNRRLTASPAMVYRCDPIERALPIFYSVMDARGRNRRANNVPA